MTTVHVGNNMIDIADPEKEVEVLMIDGTLWVNVDGVCRLRIVNIDPAIFHTNLDST